MKKNDSSVSARKLKCSSSARLGSAQLGKFQLELITRLILAVKSLTEEYKIRHSICPKRKFPYSLKRNGGWGILKKQEKNSKSTLVWNIEDQNFHIFNILLASYLCFLICISLTSSNNQFSKFRILNIYNEILFTCLINSRARHSAIYILKSRNLF